MPLTIEHHHHCTCESTQDLLNELFKQVPMSSKNILISSSNQTKGRGRQGNQWEQLDNSLAMSFSLKPNKVLTLTSLEIGVLICEYFKESKVKLKWPNDILDEHGLKSGGILCQNQSGTILVGVGLNLGVSNKKQRSETYKFGRSHLLNKEFNDQDIKDESSKIYEYILDNRIKASELREKWNSYCFHINSQVEIRDESMNITGKFIGIGENGEALINTPKGNQKAFSGSLFLD